MAQGNAPVRQPRATPLARAQLALSTARMRAVLVGDRDQAERLTRITNIVGGEREYGDRRDAGAPIVRRRTDAPLTATLGWYLRFDPHVRAQRRALGLSVPDDHELAA